MQPVQRPFRQAVDVTGAAPLGAGFRVLLAITSYERPSRSVETIAADLNDKVDLAGARRRLRTNASITLQVNNAGAGATAPLRREMDR